MFTEPFSGPGRWFSFLIQTLIIVSIISVCIETLPRLDPELTKFLRLTETIIVIIFTAEYLLRIYFSENRLRYVFSFLGLVDLLAILPFYLPTVVDLRSVRGLRLIRLVRVLKLVRFTRAVRRLRVALTLIREELAVFVFTCLILILISSVGIYYFENPEQPDVFASVFHSMWWAIATLTTVGYGDIYPITAGGKIFTGLILMIGIGIIGVPAGLMASAMGKVLDYGDEELLESQLAEADRRVTRDIRISVSDNG